MATNKRKEAAALFELIDKSTLKIPKNAGSLRIPSWWTSKNNPNPTAAPASRPSQSPPSHPANGHGDSSHAAVAPSPAPSPPPAPVPTSPQARTPAAPPAQVNASDIQSRLFESPASDAANFSPPALSPTIRPPAPSRSVSPTSPSRPADGAPSPLPATAPRPSNITPPASSGSATGTNGATSPPHAGLASGPEHDAPPEALPSKPPSAQTTRVFAPQTFAQGRPRALASPRAGSFARLPGWVLLTGLAGVVIVICCLVLLINSSRHRSLANSPSSGAPAPQPNTPDPAPRSLIPRNGALGDPSARVPAQGGASPAAPAGNDASLAGLPPPLYTSSSGDGHYWGPGQVTNRTSELLYIVISSSPSEEISLRNAKFLADHGIDLSYERRYTSGRLMYTLVSVNGFPTNASAEPYRAKIVAIGHLLPEYKTKKRAWDDAYAVRVVPKAAG